MTPKQLSSTRLAWLATKIQQFKTSPGAAERGFSVVEVVLASALVVVVVTAIIGGIVYSQQALSVPSNRTRALLLAEEGLEALRNLRDSNFSNLTNGTFGLTTTSNRWNLSGTSDTSSVFTRQVSVGSVDSNTKIVTATVSWLPAGQSASSSVTLVSYLTNWRRSVATAHGGMLVFSTGTTTLDRISYRVLSSSGTWGATTTAADVSTTTTNRVPRAVQIFASATRDEKIMISRHYDGSVQYVYAQVYNGSTWGNVQSLSSWTASTFLDVQNFSGAYLSNGNFVAIYSDNSIIPKMRIWNGTSWSSESSLTSLGTGQIPNFIVAKTRPSTNEVMVAFFTQGSDAITQYYNGSTWSGVTVHSTTAPVNTKRLIDFAWSPNNTLIGGLVYASGNTSRNITGKTWTADGSGSGAWGGSSNATVQGTGGTRIGAVAIAGRAGATEFEACANDTVPEIVCHTLSSAGTWTDPTNNIIAAVADAGIQRSFHLGFEALSGDPAVAVYSDAGTVPKLRKFTASLAAWDAASTTISTLGAVLETVRVVPDTTSDDIMILMGDTSQILYSVMWDGTNGAVYTTPAGKAFTSHGAGGAADEDYWFDFAWDQF